MNFNSRSNWMAVIALRLCVAIVSVLAAGVTAARADGAAGIASDSYVPLIIALMCGLALGGIASYYYLGFVRGKALGKDDESRVIAATREIGVVVGAFALMGGIALGITCLGLPADQGSFAAMFGTDLLISGAAAALGGLLGFFFGVPRTIDGAARAGDKDNAATTVALGANTNLERVSDWLTTLLIGATLVQIKDVPGWITQVANYVAEAPGLTNPKLIPFISLYFFVLAFLGVYLITRLYLTAALKDALGFVSSLAGAPPPTLVGQRLEAALTDGRPEGFRTALNMLADWPLTNPERRDPALNLKQARVLGRYLTSGEVDDVEARRQELKTAIENAAVDPLQKTKVLAALQTKKLTSGDAATDAELTKLVS